MEDWSCQIGLPSINKEVTYLLTYVMHIKHLMLQNKGSV